MHNVVPRVPPESSRCGSRRHLDEQHVPRVRPGYLLCDTCLDGVENALVDVPAWHLERVARARELGRPLREDVVLVVAEIVEAFSSWCALVVSLRGVRAPEPPTVTLLAGFLAVHLQWLTGRQTAAEFADDLMFLDQAVRLVVRPESDMPGPCPWPGCGERLRATACESADDQQIRCVAGHRWPPDQWLTRSREPSDAEHRDDRNQAGGTGREVA